MKKVKGEVSSTAPPFPPQREQERTPVEIGVLIRKHYGTACPRPPLQAAHEPALGSCGAEHSSSQECTPHLETWKDAGVVARKAEWEEWVGHLWQDKAL